MTLRKNIFAWLLKKGDKTNQKLYHSYKENLFRNIGGIVVEIGPGAGGNFTYLPRGTTWIGIEPNEAFHKELFLKAKEKGIAATLVSSDAAQVSLPDNYADNVLCTLVLCSVSNPSAVISEMKRILKPGGRIFFIEHVATPQDSILRSAQNIFNPLNRIIADGCNCNRETWADIQNAGFFHVELSQSRVKGMLIFHSPHIIGSAVK